MWYLVQYNDDKDCGVIESASLDSIPTRLCRNAASGIFSTNNLTYLDCIQNIEAGYDWTLARWLDEANVNTLASFTSDDPLQYLKDHYPEHYL